ncbi:MAG: hypothetical protein U9P10_07450 [Thermodesulfobacteriota bacterium]|nr:hypothetical protein [Thermodesulfobacteriota bacterium]
MLFDDEDLSAQLGGNGFQKLENEFSLEVMGKEFLSLYSKLGQIDAKIKGQI